MKVGNLKPFKPFCFLFALACERTFITTHNIESRCVIGPENILFFRRVRASFSPEIVQVGAVKGLKPHITEGGLSAELRSAESVTSRLQQLEDELMLNVLRCQLTH